MSRGVNVWSEILAQQHEIMVKELKNEATQTANARVETEEESDQTTF
jgi:hypothetical protein